jgi:hypothetical protein
MATSKEPVRLALRKLWSDHVIWTREQRWPWWSRIARTPRGTA